MDKNKYNSRVSRSESLKNERWFDTKKRDKSFGKLPEIRRGYLDFLMASALPGNYWTNILLHPKS